VTLIPARQKALALGNFGGVCVPERNDEDAGDGRKRWFEVWEEKGRKRI
jgi:hypothetical protein